MCHCKPELACHGDAIIREFTRQRQSDLSKHLAAPPSDESLRSKAAARRKLALSKQTPSKKVWPETPSVQAGRGEPIRVKSKGQFRLLYDGGGICSPGLWPPGHRNVDQGRSAAFAKAINNEFDILGESITTKLFADLIGSKTDSNPFPAEGTERIRSCLHSLADPGFLSRAPLAEPQEQPIAVRLKEALLAAFEDPDAEIFFNYEIGVRIGVGVDMPRTPAVFPEKLRWSLREQEEWGGANPKSLNYEGCTRQNYPSARKFEEEVTAALKDQESRGQGFSLPEEEARRRYGSKLTIASLAAIEKAKKPDGTTEMFILTDGSNGVNTNLFIKVRDAVPLPLADDLRTITRLQGRQSSPTSA